MLRFKKRGRRKPPTEGRGCKCKLTPGVINNPAQTHKECAAFVVVWLTSQSINIGTLGFFSCCRCYYCSAGEKSFLEIENGGRVRRPGYPQSDLFRRVPTPHFPFLAGPKSLQPSDCGVVPAISSYTNVFQRRRVYTFQKKTSKG